MYNSDAFRILQWNCNGVNSKKEELYDHVLKVNRCGKNYHVICLQETFLKPGKTFHLPGYTTVRKDREDEAKGGLLTLVRDCLEFSEISVLVILSVLF